MTGSAAVTIRTATPTDQGQVSRLLAAAFQHGDLGPWLIPDPQDRATRYRPYFTILAEHALAHGHVDLIPGIAVAVWYRHGSQPQPAIRDYLARLSAAVGPHLPRFQALAAAMHARHPTEPRHDYLAFLAVHPDRQGHGCGSLLLRHHHNHLDTDRMPAYLEATGARNQALYRQHGYQPRPPYHIGADGPALYPMWRPARVIDAAEGTAS